MAIKTVSQLDQFDNDTSGLKIGGKLAYCNDECLTKNDKDAVKADNSKITGTLFENQASYYNSFLELSKPSIAGKIENPSDPALEYESQKITYSEFIKNAIYDAKAFLNFHNNLCDYNLYDIVDGNQIFHGNKTFTDNVFTNNLSANTLSAAESVVNKFSVGNSCNIYCDVVMANDHYINGYAFGLKDGPSDVEKTNVGNVNPITKIGDPVCFVDGRHEKILSVNWAVSACNALNLIKPDGKNYDIGTANLITAGGYDEDKTVVVIKDGIPVEANEIDFAHHAFWSDLGERYLADKEYEPGTLVKFGGDKEITIADDEVNAIVSTKAFDLNAGLKDGTVIALCGRVPTKVKGKIQKFDKIMLSETAGVACKWDGKSRTIGRALESNEDEGIKLVECVTRFTV